MAGEDTGARQVATAPGFAGMTDLEAAMQGADGAALRGALAARFAELRRQVAADLAAGLPPEEFRAARAVTAALDAATAVVTASKLSTLKR